MLSEPESLTVLLPSPCLDAIRIMKMTVFWDVAPFNLVEVCLRFRGACCLHYQGDEVSPDDGSSKYLWNVSKRLPDYTTQHPRRQLFSYCSPWESEISPILICSIQFSSSLLGFLRYMLCYSTTFLVFQTERHGRVVSIPASYSGGRGFKSRPGDQLFWLRFLVVFLSPSRQMPGYYLKLGHDRFLPHPFQFIVHYHPLIRRCVVWDTESVVK
jgi:hypothetical protein